MSLNLVSTVEDFLRQRPEEKFTAREITEWIFENYNAECREKQNRSTASVTPLNTDDALKQQIIAEIGARRLRLQEKNLKVKITEDRPRKYYYTEVTDIEEIERAEADNFTLALSDNSSPTREHDLYPKLSEFLWSELKIYSNRIDEKRSRNVRGPNGNKWLYPDLVGMDDLSADWNREIKDCVKQYADRKTRLWSFEVKILVNRSNVREVFFQAVSNSSWANFGYLVASEIEGADTLKELRILSASHGIGVIKLDKNNPAESQILIPANEQYEIDWNTANRLAEENKDFLEYIKLIRQFYQTGEVKTSDWYCTVE